MNSLPSVAPGTFSSLRHPHHDGRRSRLPTATAAFVALWLAGCAVGPDYKAPVADLPTAYAHADALAARHGALPAPSIDRWWSGFDDPALTRIVERALAENLDLAAAMARVTQARAAAQGAGARLLPDVNLNGSAVRQHQSLDSPLGKLASAQPGYNRNQTVYDIGAGASWELDLFGGLRRGAEAASAEAQAAQADSAGVRVTIAGEAADAYFRVRSAQRRLAIAQDQIDTETRLLDIVKVRRGDGLATEREVAQAEALVAQARGTLPPLRIERETQLNRLDVLMGAAPGTYARELTADAARVDRVAAVSGNGSGGLAVPAIEDAGGPAALLRRRPDVIAAERRLAATNARIGAAVAEYYPKVSLSGVLGFETLAGGRVPSAATFQPLAALGVRWRLFDFGRVDAEVAQAKGANAEALARYRASMLRATEDVENAIVTLTELENQSADLSIEVKAQTRARDSAQDAYKGGAVSLYEVLDANRQLLAARDSQARVHADNARAAVATFRALGGGWE
ncbi:efflux transporter outer membrane subunit [Pandoraea terrae]|nr:efflux transporter outer membrane subunit [Pandoraea terrae]